MSAADSKSFELEYELGQEDYLVMVRASRKRDKGKLQGGLFVAFVAGCIGMTLFCAYLVYFYEADLFWGIWFFPSMLLVLLLIQHVFEPMIYRRHFKKMGLAGKTITTIIGDDGVISRNDTIESRLDWSGFIGHTEDGQHLLLWINRVQALILPYRSMASHIERDKILALVRERITTTL